MFPEMVRVVDHDIPPEDGDFLLLITFNKGSDAYARNMRKWRIGLLVAVLGCVVVPWAVAATAALGGKPSTRTDRSPAAGVATALSTITGIAISPLLGTGVYGAYSWFTAEEGKRAALPWYGQVAFWLPALLLVGLCAGKDALGATLPPGLKKPLDVLETVENKFSGLVAAGAVVPFTLDTMVKVMFADQGPTGINPALWLSGSGLATLPVATLDFTWLLNILTIPCAVALFAMVWLSSHAINVLILLSPWGAIDAALKIARTALLGLITIGATLNPWLGATLSLVVIVVAYFLAGWSFRLSVFGSVFCWDFITRRREVVSPLEKDHAMFAGPGLPGVPVRTYGRLVLGLAGAVEFVYRPWLCLAPKVVALPVDRRGMAVGTGLFFSDVLGPDGAVWFSLPPRYRGQEENIARVFLLGGGVRPAGLRKAWGVLRELLGGRAPRVEPGGGHVAR